MIGAVATWETMDPEQVVAVLEATGATIVPPDAPSVQVRGACLAIVRGPEERLELAGGTDPPAASPVGFVNGLRAIGIATVDVERLVSELRSGVAGGQPEEVMALDPWVGGRGVVVDAPSGMRLVVLEPTTEGRLAAVLARRGEAPFAAWIDLVAGAGRASSGPADHGGASGAAPTERPTALGPTVLLRAAGRWGPFLLGLPGGDAPGGHGATIPT